MRRVYHPPPFGQRPIIPLLTGLALATWLFLLLPLTQFLARPVEEPERTLRVDTPSPPPPPPPPPPPAPAEPAAARLDRPMPAPEMREPPPPLALQPLQLHLQPTLGELRGDFALDFSLAPGAIAEVEAYRLDEVDQLPRPINRIPPSYPHEMRRAGISGSVTLEFIIERDGSVSGIEIAESTHRAFEAPAIEALRRWRFTPATRNGEPVRVIARQPIPFEPN
jgi:periplasmic protein TonB